MSSQPPEKESPSTIALKLYREVDQLERTLRETKESLSQRQQFVEEQNASLTAFSQRMQERNRQLDECTHERDLAVKQLAKLQSRTISGVWKGLKSKLKKVAR